MEREDLLAFLVAGIMGRKRANRPLKVAIDGCCASGKTLLADDLASLVSARNTEVLQPSLDGFHHPRQRRYRRGEYSAAGSYEDAPSLTKAPAA